MVYKVFHTRKSRRMLKKHMRFLSKVSLPATVKLKKKIDNYIDTLKVFPRTGSKVYFEEELPSKYRKMVINKRYILIYFINKNNVYIETILDARQRNSYY